MPTPTTQPNAAEALALATDDEGASAQKLAHLWTEADALTHYPTTTETAVELLRSGGGYDASVELLEGWIRKKMIVGVSIRNGRFAWHARHILAAMIHLDAWRRFLPLDSRHIHKLSGIEVAEMQAGMTGESAFVDADKFDCQAFTVMLERCNDPQIRHAICVGFRSKLKALGVLDR